jgi:hypothetical protein
LTTMSRLSPSFGSENTWPPMGWKAKGIIAPRAIF